MVDDWTPEEWAIIERATQDLTVVDPVQAVQDAVHKNVAEAMKGFIGQKNTEGTQAQLRDMIQNIVSEQLGRDAPQIKVEPHPTDPTAVLVTTPVPATFIKMEF